MPVIETRELTKEFNGLVAVDHIDLEVRDGELFGLLGPNGAGKTTLIRMLSTLLKPTSGSAEVAGNDVRREKDEVRKSIGIVFQDPSLDTELTGRENLDFHVQMYGMRRDKRTERIAEVLNLVGLTEKADTIVKHYSGGMQRRLEIARGLMHYPKVLFLDEPTLGLDAHTRRSIWEYVKRLNREEHVTVILTTHYMEEADFLCDRVAIIDHGRIIAIDGPEELKDSLGGDMISLEAPNGALDGLEKALPGFDWIEEIKRHDVFLELRVKEGERRIPAIVGAAADAGITLNSINLRQPTLEDVFLSLTGKTIREEELDAREAAKADMRMRRRLWGRR